MNSLLATMKLQQRSERKPSGCLEWTRGRDWDGYGILRVDGRQYRAHRLAWELANNRPPDAHLVVRHTCDNPPCIEPTHLLLGTLLDNARDREERHRGADRRGEKCPTARLTWASVAEIRGLLTEGCSHASLGRQFGVSRKAISKIANGETWKS